MSAGGGGGLAGEQEVDFGRISRRLAVRWWLLAIGLVAGLFVGYLVVLGGGSFWRARAMVSFGQPWAPGGVVSSYGENLAALAAVVRSPMLLGKAAQAPGLPLAALRGHVSIGQISGAASAVGTARGMPLLTLTVEGSRPARLAAASNWLVAAVARTAGAYVDAKVRLLAARLAEVDRLIAEQTQTITRLQRQASDRRQDPLEQLARTTRLKRSGPAARNALGLAFGAAGSTRVRADRRERPHRQPRGRQQVPPSAAIDSRGVGRQPHHRCGRWRAASRGQANHCPLMGVLDRQGQAKSPKREVRMKRLIALGAVVAALATVAPAFAVSPGTNGQPSQTCLSSTAPMEPGQAAAAPGSAFNEPSASNPDGGVAGQVYAGNGQTTSTPANDAAVSQYDVACFQVSQSH